MSVFVFVFVFAPMAPDPTLNNKCKFCFTCRSDNDPLPCMWTSKTKIKDTPEDIQKQ